MSPKAILEFNLPEENREHHLAINALKYKAALEEISNRIRTYRKYGLPMEEPTMEQQIEALEQVITDVWELVPWG